MYFEIANMQGAANMAAPPDRRKIPVLRQARQGFFYGLKAQLSLGFFDSLTPMKFIGVFYISSH
jgi:hypothetical protein